MKHIFIFGFILLTYFQVSGQRWQQEISYKMDIKVDVEKNQYSGKQVVSYTNNSPDTLHHLYYHLYFNAFQPGSMMDTRSRTILDPDRRVRDRISKLNQDEIGFQKVQSLKMNGVSQPYEHVGTILEVDLTRGILPNETVTLEMKHEAQVPLQIRRSGRDNAEGIRFSMAQWYPKLAEYDYQGWHANPYVGREFHGVWGDFDVTIEIDKDYIVGGTGTLMNADEIGYGYHSEAVDIRNKKTLKWHFVAENVHDFMWAADPDYVHTTYMTKAGVLLHFFYQPDSSTTENWTILPRIMDEALTFMNERYGTYPYPSYAFIQGGDGGMEYPMATLITGKRSLGSLVGVSIHEWMHSWYQMVLATNEALYPWMDEGFTSFASSETMNYLREKGLLPGEVLENPLLGSVRGYVNFANSGREEALSTHADHYITNQAYGVGSYVKGQAFLVQLKYILGEEDFYKGLKRYYNTWKFKHPNANDCIRVMEKQSGIELDWFKEYWVNTTKTIDYAIDTVYEEEGKTKVLLKNNGRFPMPQELTIQLKNGEKQTYIIPLRIMRGHRPLSNLQGKELVAEDWPWTHPTYLLSTTLTIDEIDQVLLDQSEEMADVNRANNVWSKTAVE
jgi:hypothetical protein